MKAFPLLQTEVNRITVEHIRNQEQKCKEHVEFMINYELAYINTNHEVKTKKLNKWFNSQAPEPFKGPRARFARSGENGEGKVRSL